MRVFDGFVFRTLIAKYLYNKNKYEMLRVLKKVYSWQFVVAIVCHDNESLFMCSNFGHISCLISSEIRASRLCYMPFMKGY